MRLLNDVGSLVVRLTLLFKLYLEMMRRNPRSIFRPGLLFVVEWFVVYGQ